jgi:hypothetical protein
MFFDNKSNQKTISFPESKEFKKTLPESLKKQPKTVSQKPLK